MASQFITPQEVLDIAFDNKNVNLSKIPDIKIQIAELSWLRPVITQDLYDRLNRANAGLNADEIALKVLLKNALAFFVKYECLPDINIQTTNKGSQVPQTPYSDAGGAKERVEQRDTCKRHGEILMDDIVRYIEDDANYSKFSTYYQKAENVNNRMSRNHGIIIPDASKRYTDMDDYYLNNPQ